MQFLELVETLPGSFCDAFKQKGSLRKILYCVFSTIESQNDIIQSQIYHMMGTFSMQNAIITDSEMASSILRELLKTRDMKSGSIVQKS